MFYSAEAEFYNQINYIFYILYCGQLNSVLQRQIRKESSKMDLSFAVPCFFESFNHSSGDLPKPEYVHNSQHRRHRQQGVEAQRIHTLHLKHVEQKILQPLTGF